MFAFPEELRIGIDDPLKAGFQRIPSCCSPFYTCLREKKPTKKWLCSETSHAHSSTLNSDSMPDVHSLTPALLSSQARPAVFLFIHSFIMYLVPTASGETDIKHLIIHTKNSTRDFPSGPVARTQHSQYRRAGFDAWSGN